MICTIVAETSCIANTGARTLLGHRTGQQGTAAAPATPNRPAAQPTRTPHPAAHPGSGSSSSSSPTAPARRLQQQRSSSSSSSSSSMSSSGGGPRGRLSEAARQQQLAARTKRPGGAGASSSSGRSGGSSSSSSAAAKQPEAMIIHNPQHFKNNLGVVYFLRIYTTIVAGAAVGILGVEGWAGILLYLVSQLACTAPILLKCGGSFKQYFPSWDKVVLEHVFSSTAILSYILFWMIFYNLCHIF